MCKADLNTHYFCNKKFCDGCKFEGERKRENNSNKNGKQKKKRTILTYILRQPLIFRAMQVVLYLLWVNWRYL